MMMYIKHKWKLIGKEGDLFVYQCVWCKKIVKRKKKGQ